MTDDTRTLRFVPDLQASTARRLVRTGLALAGVLVVVPLVAVLPGVDRLFAGLTVSPWAVLLAVVTVIVAGALVRVAPTVERAVAESLDGPDAVVANAAAAAKLLVGFAAVVIAYRGLAPAVAPTFRAFDLGGVYHLAFLVVGLFVLGAFVRRLHRCWEPLTELLTDRLVDDAGGRGDGATVGTSTGR